MGRDTALLDLGVAAGLGVAADGAGHGDATWRPSVMPKWKRLAAAGGCVGLLVVLLVAAGIYRTPERTGPPCEEVHCNRHGSCKENDDGSFLVCQCVPGWTGDGCLRPQLPAVITVDAKASVPERRAADSLAAFLNRISGTASFRVRPADAAIKGTPQIAVGFGAAALLGVHRAAMESMGLEGVLATTSSSRGVPPGSAALTGGKGAPRGALYAVNEFLERLGVQFLDRLPGGTKLPAALPDDLPAMDIRFIPPLEYRQQYTFGLDNYDAFRTTGIGDATMDFNVHRRANKASDSGESPDAAHGGAVVYASPPGFVHTSYNLLCSSGKCGGGRQGPPPGLWATNREWFWPRDNPNTEGQLCWSNASLQQFIVGNLKQQLKSQPAATIVSVSQNDNPNHCQDPAELKINDEEGTAGGALFRAVNAIAETLQPEFPAVAIDTLAYKWSRPAPKLLKPRGNVIIRLCPIECNYAVPMTDPSNAEFQSDLSDWSAASNRTFIWNYQTNFDNFMTPFPDWYSIGPNARYFQQHGVTGIFQEGAYQSPGSDLMELKDYLSTRMMWDPSQDDRQVIDQFLRLYYGGAAPHVRLYMDTIHAAAVDTSYFMRKSFPVDAAFLTPIALLTSAASFTEGRAAVSGVELERLGRAAMSLYYVVLMRWAELRSFAQAEQINWPLEPTMEAAFAYFAANYNATARQYGRAPSLIEGTSGSLAQVRAALFVPSSACLSGESSRKLPVNVSASDWYPPDAPRSLLGSINEGGHEGWVK